MPTTAAETVQRFIDAFVAAWPVNDAETVASFFAEDAVYQNGPLEPVHGRDAIRDTVAAFMEMGGQAGVDIVHMLANGQLVMTERIDHFITPERTLSLPMMGIFEVHNGLITAWRDYFDLNQFTSQMGAGG